MMKPSWAFDHIPKWLEWGCRNRDKTTIPKEFLTFLEIVNREQVTLDRKYGKIFLVDFLYSRHSRQLSFSENFPVLLHLEEVLKGQR